MGSLYDGANALRQSKSDIRLVKGENNMPPIAQLNQIKQTNFNETFNPGPIANTINNYNLAKINGGNVDIRSSMKLNEKTNILVVDETKGIGNLRESSTNIPIQRTVNNSKNVNNSYGISQTKVNIIDIAENHLVGGNNLELSFRNGDAIKGAGVRPGVNISDKKFPKDVFSFNIKKKFAT